MTGDGAGADEYRVYAMAENPARWLLARYLREMERFVEPAPDGVTYEELQDHLSDLSTTVEELWSKRQRTLREDERQLAGFRSQIRDMWGRPLDSLFYFIRQCIQTANVSMQRQHDLGRKHDPLFTALRHLHARACRASWEIHTLLAHGFSDGADARWRTLHEIAVTATFVRLHGSECATRYLEHDVVTTIEDIRLRTSVLGGPKPDGRWYAELLERRDQLAAKYGRVFLDRYGWADAFLPPNEQRNFAGIQRSAGMGIWRYAYSTSSHPVHAYSRNLLSPFYQYHGAEMSLAGPSAAGLELPAIQTARSLFQATAALLALYPSPWEPQGGELSLVVALDSLARRVVTEWTPADHSGPRPDDDLNNEADTEAAPQHDPVSSMSSPDDLTDDPGGAQEEADLQEPSDPVRDEGQELGELPDDFEQLGLRRMSRQEWSDALAAFDEAIARGVDTAVVRSARTIALVELGRLDDALEDAKAAVDREPQSPAHRCNLGMVLLRLDRAEEALKETDAGLALDPNLRELLGNRANCLRVLGRLDEALKEYGALALADIASPEILHGTAATLVSMGMDEDALTCFSRELQVGPVNPVHTLIDRAKTLTRLNRLDLALVDAETAAGLSPKDMRLREAGAQIRAKKGDKAGAVADYLAAATAVERDPEALSNISVSLSDLGSYSEALVLLDRALEIDPLYSAAHVNRGVCLSHLERSEEAEVAFRRAADCDPRNAYAHLNLAATILSADRVSEAIEHAQIAVQLDRHVPGAQSLLGRLLVVGGDFEAAAESLEKALQVAEDDWRAHYDFAICDVARHRLRSAADHLKRAFAIHPSARKEAFRDPQLQALRNSVVWREAGLPAQKVARGAAQPRRRTRGRSSDRRSR